MTNSSHISTQSVCILLVVFLCAVSTSLSLSPNLDDDDQNIVGDPTIFNIDVPHARVRRQTSNTTSKKVDATTTGATTTTTTTTANGTRVTGSASPVVTSNAKNTSDKGDTTTARAATTEAGSGVVTPANTGAVDGVVHWADHNETFEDDHDYYKVKYIPPGAEPERYWVDIDSQIDNAQSPADIKADYVTTTTRRAKTVQLKFDFEFYGHDIKKLLVTTGGFLYVGTYVHRFLAATQYIAPLMANFDPSVTANASIRYVDNGTSFTAEWKNIALADNARDGEFTFQTTLFSDGRIVFAYKEVPVAVTNINTKAHPVRIGLADAYYNDTYLSPFSYFGIMLKKRSIYEYHKVVVDMEKVVNNMAIEITPNPTCHDLTNCHSCATSDISFNCSWCPSQGRCSSGFDRHRQAWVEAKCDIHNITIEADCNRPHVVDVTPTKGPAKQPSKRPTKKTIPRKPDDDEDAPNIIIPHKAEPQPKTSGGTSYYGGIVFIFVIIIVLAVILGWVVYAYRRPTSNSGIFLIELRNKFRRKVGDSNIKYKYHKPDVDDQSVEHV